MKRLYLLFFVLSFLTNISCSKEKLIPLPITVKSIAFDEKMVTSASPVNNVSISPSIIITFSQPISPSEDNLKEITIIRDTDREIIPLERLLNKDKTILTISIVRPLDAPPPLGYKTAYKLIITALLTDENKNQLKQAVVITFQTEDSKFLRVKSISIDGKEASIGIFERPKTLQVSARPSFDISFFHVLDPNTVKFITLKPEAVLKRTLSNNNTSLTLTLLQESDLEHDKDYKLIIPSSTLKSIGGKTLTNGKEISFHTAAFSTPRVIQISVDTQTVDLLSPTLNNVDVRPRIRIVFSQEMQKDRMTDVFLSKNGQTINMTYTISDSKTLILTKPITAPLERKSVYKLIIPSTLSNPKGIRISSQTFVTLNTSKAAAPMIKNILIDEESVTKQSKIWVRLNPRIKISFIEPIKDGGNIKRIILSKDGQTIPLVHTLNKTKSLLIITLVGGTLEYDALYILTVPTTLEGTNGRTFQNEFKLTLHSVHAPPRIQKITVDTKVVNLSTLNISEVSSRPEILINFTKEIRVDTGKITLVDSSENIVPTTFSLFGKNTIRIDLNQSISLNQKSTYRLRIPNNLKSAEGVNYGISSEITLQTK